MHDPSQPSGPSHFLKKLKVKGILGGGPQAGVEKQPAGLAPLFNNML
jgi:hypothetical protein